MPCFRMVRLIWLFACLGVCGSSVGCNSNRTDEVSGTITLKGKAPKVEGLRVCFLGKNGRLASAPVNTDGTYKATEVPTGECQVSFQYLPPDFAAQAQEKGRLVRPGSEGERHAEGGAKDGEEEPHSRKAPGRQHLQGHRERRCGETQHLRL